MVYIGVGLFGNLEGDLKNNLGICLLLTSKKISRMTLVHEPLKTRMVTQPHSYLKVWWKYMNERDKRAVVKHIGHLLSLMEMEAWPDLIGTMIKFWDSENMVFRFGTVEMAPTKEEIVASYESVGMCNKRKTMPDSDILIPKIWSPIQIKEAFSLVKAEWMDRLKGPNLPLRKLYYRFGHARAFEKFGEEFTSKQTWEEKRAFVVCLLGSMVFPQNLNHSIHPSIVMVTHAIFYGVNMGLSTKYYMLAPMILVDIYRALDKCQNGSRFFQGCNLILQWWMMKHLLKSHNPTEPNLKTRHDQFSSHSWWLYYNDFKGGNGRQFWQPIHKGLKNEDVQWTIDNLVVGDTVVRSRDLPFLVLPGLRGTRPYAPGRVLRQLGCKQVTPQTGEMKKFVMDHENGQVAFAKMIIREWQRRRIIGDKVPKRFNAECSDAYKEWLKENLVGTIGPGPNVPYCIKDVEAESQALLRRLREKYQENELAYQRQHSEDAKTINHLKQELRRIRQCIVGLDDQMELQIQTMKRARLEEEAQLVKDHLQGNRYFIWEEVDIAKRARTNEGPEAI